MYTEYNYFHCLCGTHVHQGAFLIALLGCIEWGLAAFPLGAVAVAIDAPALLAFVLVIGIPPWTLLFANRHSQTCLYWPFLVVYGIVLAFSVVLSVVMFLFGVTALLIGLPQHLRHNQVYGLVDQLSVFFVVLVAFLCMLGTYVQYYLLRVVYRDYRFLKSAAEGLDERVEVKLL